MSGPTGPRSVSVRTGALRRSMQMTNSVEGNVLRFHAAIGVGSETDRWKARAHEFGANIVPKKARALAIPTSRMVTAAGVGRVPGPRDVAGLFMIKKAGRMFLARSLGAVGKKLEGGSRQRGGKKAKGQIEVLFILVKGVRLPPRLHFRENFKIMSARLREDLKQAAREILRPMAKRLGR